MNRDNDRAPSQHNLDHHAIAKLRGLVRTVPHFPKPGIMFRDITTLILDPWGLKETMRQLLVIAQEVRPQKIVAIDSRGFLFGSFLAHQMNIGVALARKKGKLPGETVQQSYQLEYGTDTLEIHKGAVELGEKCLIVDDLLATGGTAEAAALVVEKMGGRVAGMLFIVNLPELNGSKKLSIYNPKWLMEFDGH